MAAAPNFLSCSLFEGSEDKSEVPETNVLLYVGLLDKNFMP